MLPVANEKYLINDILELFCVMMFIYFQIKLKMCLK